ncbi:MAG TPA: hypothetical protein P5026_07525 [Kiritimatiellia bacterium]|nr:hypothetical protein [Kiritimatiellia bacterium]HRU69670.1 hypothetical protein [Kiritimatiellia bacterium]
MAYVADLLDHHPQNPKNRKKSRRQQAKEAQEKLAAEARAKNINTVYRQLARLFHPDLEQDPELKSKKEQLMKELTAAYEAGDLHTILMLELRWLQNNDGDISRLSDDKLRAYTVALEKQSDDIQAEISTLVYHPRYIPLGLDTFSIRNPCSVLVGILKEDARAIRESAVALKRDADSLGRLFAQPPGKERDKQLRAFLRDLNRMLIRQTDMFARDIPF